MEGFAVWCLSLQVLARLSSNLVVEVLVLLRVDGAWLVERSSRPLSCFLFLSLFLWRNGQTETKSVGSLSPVVSVVVEEAATRAFYQKHQLPFLAESMVVGCQILVAVAQGWPTWQGRPGMSVDFFS